MGLNWLKKQRHRINQFALNPAKGTRQAVLDKPSLAPIVKAAADAFTFGIGGAIAEKGFKKDIAKGRVVGLGPNAPMPPPDPQSIDVSTPITVPPGEPVLGEQAQFNNMISRPRPLFSTRAQLANVQTTRVVQMARHPRRLSSATTPYRSNPRRKLTFTRARPAPIQRRRLPIQRRQR